MCKFTLKAMETALLVCKLILTMHKITCENLNVDGRFTARFRLYSVFS